VLKRPSSDVLALLRLMYVCMYFNGTYLFLLAIMIAYFIKVVLYKHMFYINLTGKIIVKPLEQLFGCSAI